jgi:hypothetical protein
MRDVGAEGTGGKSIGDNIGHAQQLIANAKTDTQTAQANFDKAFLLASHDNLTSADTHLVSAQKQLDGITKAEELLAAKQQKVQSDLGQLHQRLGGTQQNANNVWVRDHAKQLVGQAGQSVAQADQSVNHTPHNPYSAAQSIATAESAREQAETAMSADKQAYDAARSEISDAQSAIGTATAKIGWAAMQTFSYSQPQGGSASGRVEFGDLIAANAALAQATSSLQRAQELLRDKQFEASAEAARASQGEAGNAETGAALAVESAEERFNSSSAKRAVDERQEAYDEEQARIRREAEEARERAEAAAAAERQREADEARQREESDRGSSLTDMGSGDRGTDL